MGNRIVGTVDEILLFNRVLSEEEIRVISKAAKLKEEGEIK